MSARVPARPSLAAIDKAIRLIESGDTYLTCWALFHADNKRGGCPNANIYVQQYRDWVTHVDGYPSWWNASRTERNKARRIAALKSFRQACIDAAVQAPGAAPETQP